MNTLRIVASLAVAVLATVGGYYTSSHYTSTSHLAVASDASNTTEAAVTTSKAGAVDELWKAPLQNAAGTSQGIAAFKGKPIVLNFWASWCGPCVREMPSLAVLQREYAKKGITFIGVGVDSEKNVNEFLQKIPVGYPIYIAGFGGADLARSFGNNAGALPYTVVIDAKGQVRSTKLGEVDQKELKATLDAL
ncbi:TlpA family protein disulfide reductase [Caballeronia sp.]|jgi:thiol-disulfide isomerase/thioredoxin|uniref:TlpA family protein disulfide reductase n=1 Tax=Caballeronia sp. TaxID=1931223 RepID=UPI003C5DFC2F